MKHLQDAVSVIGAHVILTLITAPVTFLIVLIQATILWMIVMGIKYFGYLDAVIDLCKSITCNHIEKKDAGTPNKPAHFQMKTKKNYRRDRN